MSIHSIFAANLRSKCAEYGTIADVCRDIGINRQQFNKYLAGTSFPNAVTLRNICKILDVQEQSLFATDLIAGQNPKAAIKASRPGLLGILPLQKRGFDFIVPDLALGFYYCYFPLPNVSGMLVRSLILVVLDGKQKEFIRLTRLQSPGESKRPLLGGRHNGIVCANNSEIYFFGLNRQSPYQLSMLALERRQVSRAGVYRGMALTQNFNASTNPKVCLFLSEEQNNSRLLISSIGIVHESDPSVDPAVRATLHST